jgi:hypothetical protein
LGWDLVAGKNRVPSPAAGKTAFLIFIFVCPFPDLEAHPKPDAKSFVKLNIVPRAESKDMKHLSGSDSSPDLSFGRNVRLRLSPVSTDTTQSSDT